MLLISIYHMTLTGETFNPSDYETFNKPNIKQSKISITQALEVLKANGIDISQLDLSSIDNT